MGRVADRYRYVVIEGLDHGMTSGLDPVTEDYDTVALIQALLVLTVRGTGN